MDDTARRLRAGARQGRAILRKARLHDAGDPVPLHGAEAVALVAQLTSESWSLSGRPLPGYTRDDIPCRFVPRRTS